ncbi:UDP-N-acetylglucosamine 1-carboxyvinyltransferase [candidate division KSB1 bacterium]
MPLEKFIIEGGRPISGRVEVSGAKNAVLPIMCAGILAEGEYTVDNAPRLRDVDHMGLVLRELGVRVEREDHRLKVDSTGLAGNVAPYELIRKMRAGIYVLGPLLARTGRARVSLPGGCAWGPRPVDLHVSGLRALGVRIELNHGYIDASCDRLKGALIRHQRPSVGATCNIMMAAVLAQGTTTIENAAREPEVVALADFLISMGADISGAGSHRLQIQGVKTLQPAGVRVIPDRIEAGTFMALAALTGGPIQLDFVHQRHLTAIARALEATGCLIEFEDDRATIRRDDPIRPVDVDTEPFPGFPTDMQAQLTALMTIADGESRITDTIYGDRFTHAPELSRLGADITVEDNVARVRGVKKLSGASLMATDLRASAALVLAGLVAEGETEIRRVYHIDRGYESIEDKLRKLGARIRREQE